MKPEHKSQTLLSVTRSKAKMLEYSVPEKYHIKIPQDPAKLFTLTIGILGDLAAGINRDELKIEDIENLRTNLIFSAQFFDSYFLSRLNKNIDSYLILLGSASYYLGDLPGSSMVLAKSVLDDIMDIGGEGLEDLLLWLLQGDLSTYFEGSNGPYGNYIDVISSLIIQFFQDGHGIDKLNNLANKLRSLVYISGTPRQLLFGDVITAVLKKKIQNSTWNALPLYSGLSIRQWLPALQKESFIKELWPAQHLLGREGVLKGESAVVQMPTSAGKTKATELIIRSGFLANRTSLAVIIAPFRALCHEIKNNLVSAFRKESIRVDELSDVMQADFEISELLSHQQILVVTPEKFLYVLRHAPELALNVGIIIFDEGHQFDSGSRGITYELLLTSLRLMLPKETQKVLISAVISNAESVGEWLNGEPKVVAGTNLIPTFRSVGFASWLDRLGRIEYISAEDYEKTDFFVPRVIESIKLNKKPGEIKDRFFPEKSKGQSIALYLGLKLVLNGSVAIFCGRKPTAAKICESAVEVIERGVPLQFPYRFSDKSEIDRLYYLHVQNLGKESTPSKSAKYGIFSHHGNTPHGIRLAVEHAMSIGLVRFVVCTSTLAQGVNLPLRYLIVTSVYQGSERIKVRDFHNLIGRAGRAGMHTEGSILFADPIVFDKRKNPDERWRWKQIKELLEPKNSEPCISNLLSIFDPIKSDDGKRFIRMEPMDFARAYIGDPEEITKFTNAIIEKLADKGFSKYGVERQISWKINLICSIESFLLSQWDVTEKALSEADIVTLSKETLAFYLADEGKQEKIIELFKLIADNIATKISDPQRRIIYGRTLYGFKDAQGIEKWVDANLEQLRLKTSDNEILDLVWDFMTKHIYSKIFNKFDKPFVLNEIALHWIRGYPFYELMEIIEKRKAKMIWGQKFRKFKIDHVVEVCEGALSYEGALLISAIKEFVEFIDPEGTTELIVILEHFQKQLKYGLPSVAAISCFELGFSDRAVALDLTNTLKLSNEKKSETIKVMRDNKETVRSVIEKYPSYFKERMEEIL